MNDMLFSSVILLDFSFEPLLWLIVTLYELYYTVSALFLDF